MRALVWLLHVAGCLCIGVVVVFAQQQQGGLEQRFAQLDRDGDGRLSREELPEGLRAGFGRADHDGDGFLSLDEARAAFANRRRGDPQAADRETEFPAPEPAGLPQLSQSDTATGLTFTRDYEPGTRDAAGQYRGGTETMRLLAHDGRLFASTGVWMDVPYLKDKGEQPWTGPQILVKDSAGAPWRVEQSFPDCVRVDGMEEVTFTTDAAGAELTDPVTMLVCGPSSPTSTATWTRDAATGIWSRCTDLPDRRGGLRSFGSHVDRVTGISHLFAGGTRDGGIFRAVYDPVSPGRVRFAPEPELTGTGRVMCFAEADGVLYAACGVHDETNQGGLYRRVDGPEPSWELLWRQPHITVPDRDEFEILRGLTAVPDPANADHEVLVCTAAFPGVVYRFDPAQPRKVVTELDIRAYLSAAWGLDYGLGPCLSAYNQLEPFRNPATGEMVHLIGCGVGHPAGRDTDHGASAWYLVRHLDGSYGLGRVFDPQHPRPNGGRGLLAVRTLQVSPFPEDAGRVIYCGGFDCASIESHNTAWIYCGRTPTEEEETP